MNSYVTFVTDELTPLEHTLYKETKMKKSRKVTIYGLLERDHRATFQKLNQFYDALNRLRYEGRMTLGRNMAEIHDLVAYFKRELCGHMKDEEKTLFPFVSSHIPRLEPMVYLLLSEHEDFKSNLQSLEKSIREFKRKKFLKQSALDSISEKGTYLICLLRSHMWVESCSLYRAVDKELRSDEKRSLIKRIKERGGERK